MAAQTPLIVIVPGAFHSVNAYPELTKLLQDSNYEVIQVPLVTAGDDRTDPSVSHLDDADAIRSVLAPLFDQGREAVFLSHSYGSMPSTEAIAGNTVEERTSAGLRGGVSAFICCAGFSFPKVGKNLYGGDELPPLMPYHRLENGLLYLDESAKPLWFSDLPEERANRAFAELCKTHTRKTFETFPLHVESELRLKKTYILCEEDKTILPEWQEGFAKIGGFDNIVKVTSGHSPFLSQPQRILEIIQSVQGE
ncbi:Alpha/beta hydrolase fold-1 [Xylariales sp. PMI_506]|nr:Alpha/beta hydrolase fold-1 [Xylariales sp. PMI_506]